jgi:hypothetical protein
MAVAQHFRSGSRLGATNTPTPAILPQVPTLQCPAFAMPLDDGRRLHHDRNGL